MNDLISQLESLLFVSNKPLTLKALTKYTGADPAAIEQALQQLHELRKDSGIVVLMTDNEYQLATNSNNTEAVKTFLNSDLREALTDATVEVLAIIAYRQPIAKAEIEAIRGVNSQYSIRALLMRGLIEKIPNPGDARGMLYQITTEFLQHLGITSVNDLPDFDTLVANIKLPDIPAVKDDAASNSEPAEPIITE
ncbi:MAG: SMC-Scp complex subunit ScpB [bacterium]|nr:SMC-Scp complex subunit ScpB [bacterium]